MSNIYLQAAQLKLRFDSNIGQLMTEQLFDLPLTSAKGASLDDVAKRANSELKKFSEESFVGKASEGKSVAELKLEIAKDVIAIAQAKLDAAKNKAAIEDEKRRLLAALDSAENKALASLTPDQIRQRLKDLQ